MPAGHVHNYYRTCAVIDGDCDDEGVVHLVVGSGGHELTQHSFDDDTVPWLSHYQARLACTAHHARTVDAGFCGC